MSLKVVSFNMLAPCYKRTGAGSGVESDQEDVWRVRQEAIANLLKSMGTDAIVCLQEYWFDHPAFQALYETSTFPASDYAQLLTPRTAHKRDGLAIFCPLRTVALKHREHVLYRMEGNRVGQIASFSLPSFPQQGIEAKNEGETCILAHTHLTFPHHEADIRMRQKQISKLLESVARFQERHGLQDATVLLTGDMNTGTPDCGVLSLIRAADFTSAFATTHGGQELRVSHRDHNGNAVAVDFCFVRQGKGSKLRVTAAELHPHGLSTDAWPAEEDWGLSDHRPLVVSFSLTDKDTHT